MIFNLNGFYIPFLAGKHSVEEFYVEPTVEPLRVLNSLFFSPSNPYDKSVKNLLAVRLLISVHLSFQLIPGMHLDLQSPCHPFLHNPIKAEGWLSYF